MITVMAEPNIQGRITLKDMIFGKINFCELKNFALNENLIGFFEIFCANKCSNDFQSIKSLVELTSFFSIFFFYITSFN